MKLLKYRVTNFRSVEDSGWIETDNVTSLIGVNESGKTNLLVPLWKLNPARDGEIQPTSDYPKSKFAAIDAAPDHYCFVEAVFELANPTPLLLARTKRSAEDLKLVSVKRFYNGTYSVSFPNCPKETSQPKETVLEELTPAFADIKTALDNESDQALSTSVSAVLSEVTNRLSDTSSLELTLSDATELAKLCNDFPGRFPKGSPLGKVVRTLKKKISELEDGFYNTPPEKVPTVKDLILRSIPKFVYYSNYGNLDSEIYLPQVVENAERDDLGSKESAKARTLRVLFSFVALEPEEILDLGRDFEDPSAPGRRPTPEEIEEIAERKRKRSILLQSAGTNLTREFKDWWKQGTYRFRFQADGNHFRIWVSDEERPEEIELESRSTGLQWFLSFYLVFLVESDKEHDNTILLLDEPGLSLHPLAQRDLSDFFESLSESNQIIYTTHSPFLVDADMLDRARKVFIGKDGTTKASADLRQGFGDPRKSGAAYAVYSALNMNVAESLLVGCQPIIVEGPSDQHYMSMMKAHLIGLKKIAPKQELVFPPAHGANNAKVVASILTGKDEALPIILLDGDDAGKRMQNDMKNGLYQSEKDKILSTDQYSSFEKSEVEDLVPPDLIVNALDRMLREADIPFEDSYLPTQPIVPQIEQWAEQQELELHQGWKVDIAKAIKTKVLTKGLSEDQASYSDIWLKIFEDFGLQ